MGLFVALILVNIVCCLSVPLDDPVHIDLPVYDQPQVNSDTRLAEAIEPENYPGGERAIDQAHGGNFINYKFQAASNLIGGNLQSQINSISLGPFSPPISTLESAIQETEGLGSKTLSIKENIQNIVAGLLQPKPIVDTISESEKYGNTGDKFYDTGKVIVGGAEGVSNIVNSVLEIPGTIIKKITRAATEKLNNLGGRLIGL